MACDNRIVPIQKWIVMISICSMLLHVRTWWCRRAFTAGYWRLYHCERLLLSRQRALSAHLHEQK